MIIRFRLLCTFVCMIMIRVTEYNMRYYTCVCVCVPFYVCFYTVVYACFEREQKGASTAKENNVGNRIRDALWCVVFSVWRGNLYVVLQAIRERFEFFFLLKPKYSNLTFKVRRFFNRSSYIVVYWIVFLTTIFFGLLPITAASDRRENYSYTP